MCYLSNVTYKLNGTKSNYKAACGPRLVKEVIGNLHVPEDVAVTTNSFMMPFSYGDAFMRLPGGDESPKVRLKGCDDGFWRVYRFDFVEGRPFPVRCCAARWPAGCLGTRRRRGRRSY